MSATLDLIRKDLSWLQPFEGRDPPVGWGWVRVVFRCLASRGLRAVLLFRLAHAARARGFRVIQALLWRWMFRSCGAEIAPTARIGGGLRLPHPQGIVIGGRVEVGEMVTIGQNVTLGANFGRTDSEGRAYPRIGDSCVICAGAVVVGPIEIGKGSIVGANSVVTESVPPNAIAAGNPAKVVKRIAANDPRTHPPELLRDVAKSGAGSRQSHA